MRQDSYESASTKESCEKKALNYIYINFFKKSDKVFDIIRKISTILQLRLNLRRYILPFRVFIYVRPLKGYFEFMEKLFSSLFTLVTLISKRFSHFLFIVSVIRLGFCVGKIFFLFFGITLILASSTGEEIKVGCFVLNFES